MDEHLPKLLTEAKERIEAKRAKAEGWFKDAIEKAEVPDELDEALLEYVLRRSLSVAQEAHNTAVELNLPAAAVRSELEDGLATLIDKTFDSKHYQRGLAGAGSFKVGFQQLAEDHVHSSNEWRNIEQKLNELAESQVKAVASTSVVGRLSSDALVRIEAARAAFMAEYLPILEREANRRGPVHDAELLRELVVNHFNSVARECMTVCGSPEEFDAALHSDIAELVHYYLSSYQWIEDPMREELDQGFAFFVSEVNPWAFIPEEEKATTWHVGAITAEALSHGALKLRAEAWNLAAAGGFSKPEKPQSASINDAISERSSSMGRGAEPSVASWERIEISFLSDERVQIRDGSQIETRNYAEFGFADGRNGKPDQAWLTLRALAEARGTIRDGAKTGRDWPKVEKRMQKIRKALRNHFGISADPVPFVEGTGYQACFKIGCSPSFHT